MMVDTALTDPAIGPSVETLGQAKVKRRKAPFLRQLTAGEIVRHVILIGMLVVVVAPFLWMMLGSFKTYEDLMGSPGTWPNPFTLANFEEIFFQTPFASAFINSFLLATAKVIAACVTSLVLGYIFAKYRFPGSRCCSA